MRPTDVSALEVRHMLPAPRSRVFAYWTDPEQVRRWLGGPAVKVPSAAIDLRVGGKYEYRLISPEGVESKILGEFLTVLEPQKLVYTWIVENDVGSSPETRVTVDFGDLGDRTEVTILHEGFLTDGSRRLHEEGWFGCLDTLEEMLS